MARKPSSFFIPPLAPLTLMPRLFHLHPHFLTICISSRRRIVFFRPYALPAEKNETECTYLTGSQPDSEIFTNQPAGKSAGNAACGHPVCRISVFMAKDINAARDGH